MKPKRVAQLRTAEDFRTYQVELGIDLDFDDEVQSGPDAPLAQPLTHRGRTIGNRFSVLPMEGWDGTPDGLPTDFTRRRWQRFGESGAKLIWGGEAVAVRPDGRANPLQLMLLDSTMGEIEALRKTLLAAHAERYGSTDDMLVGLQLTHSGRFARPYDKQTLEPRTLYAHPVLDEKFAVDPGKAVFSDDEIDRLIDDFVLAAGRAQKIGFDFVDLKHCHGYLGHEFLTAYDRPGKYGGSFENRTRFLRTLTERIRSEVPGLEIGVRVSIFDFVPFRPDSDHVGEPNPVDTPYRYAFGSDESGLQIDLTEPIRLLEMLQELEIRLVCLTAGSPYYNPHIQRPALFPPSDGYLPPEDPLVGVARQINTVAALNAQFPELLTVGTGYSYLQEWLPNVAQNVVRTNKVDSVGIGRMVLSYPDIVADVLGGKPLQRKRICRTFSDCTTAPRNGIVSGCYPLDDFYKNSPEHDLLKAAKGT